MSRATIGRRSADCRETHQMIICHFAERPGLEYNSNRATICQRSIDKSSLAVALATVAPISPESRPAVGRV